MGGTSSTSINIFDWILSKPLPEKNVALIGLDGAGKTTILSRLKYNEVHKTTATIGFNVEKIKIDNKLILNTFDVGGQSKIRQQWKYYYQSADAIIYVIDSSDKDRLKETLEELSYIFDIIKYQDPAVPILILANKQDQLHVLAPESISDQLRPLVPARLKNKLFIAPCIAIDEKDLGITDGIMWLTEHLYKSTTFTTFISSLFGISN